MEAGILRESPTEVQDMLGTGWSGICTIQLKTG